MDARRRLGLLLPCLLVMAVGCGRYTIVFEVQEVINTDANNPNDDTTSKMLEVDIVCITPKDAEEHPGIVNETMRADAWFHARDTSDAKIGSISSKRIYALRRGNLGDKRDTKVGEPLLSGRDLPREHSRKIAVQIVHPKASAANARIVIYGRFHAGNAVSKVPPLVIDPPAWGKIIHIKVGRTNLIPASTE